jgi:hypothetical protein
MVVVDLVMKLHKFIIYHINNTIDILNKDLICLDYWKEYIKKYILNKCTKLNIFFYLI